MKQSLQLRQSTALTLTPQLQQSIKLLQLSTLDLHQEIERYLAENPLLERDEASPDGYPDGYAMQATPSASGQDNTPGDTHTESAEPAQAEHEPSVSDLMEWPKDEYGRSERGEDDEGDYSPQPAAVADLRGHLESQLRLANLSDRDLALVLYLVDALDDDGYLGQSLQDIAEQMPPELEVDEGDLQVGLRLIQSCEPVGVGARNLAECLSLQMAVLPDDLPGLALARRVVAEALDLLASRDFIRLRRQLAVSEEALREAQALIVRLNPRPGAAYSGEAARYIVPDVLVRKTKGTWQASLNPDAMPKLRINQMYANILHQRRDRGGSLSGQLQEARWLINNVQQRFETILRVAQAIVERQHRFFEHGEVAMRPLVLREIADLVGLHESTVSRVTTQKFMMTPRGIFELKYFFGSHVETEAGGACSSIAIRALIKQLVAGEDHKKPLSDSAISDVLAKQGIIVARRTIAKYRESLQIPPVSQRKAI